MLSTGIPWQHRALIDHPEREPLKVLGKHYASVVDIMIQELDLGAWKQEEHLGPRPRESWYGGGHSELERDSQTLWSQESSHSFNNYWECQRSFVYVSCIFNTIVPILDTKTEIKKFFFSIYLKITAKNKNNDSRVIPCYPGEGNGSPFQYSCLRNPMDRGTWQATVHELTKSWTQLSN